VSSETEELKVISGENSNTLLAMGSLDAPKMLVL
jgi:hypothetical protein